MLPAVVMFSKLPEPGACKTRLHTDLTPELAAALQEAFLADLAHMLAAQTACLPYIAYSPASPDARRYFSALLPAGQVFPQEGVDLGARMLAAVRRLMYRGHTPVLVIGSDLPTLQPATLNEAVTRLAEQDLVIGPSTDGGYWMIGMNCLLPELFAHVPWGTAGVLAETIRRAQAIGVRTALLPPDTDIDTWPDVLRLHSVLQAPPADWMTMPARTAVLVATLVEATPTG